MKFSVVLHYILIGDVAIKGVVFFLFPANTMFRIETGMVFSFLKKHRAPILKFYD